MRKSEVYSMKKSNKKLSANFVTYAIVIVAFLLCQLALYYWKRGEVETTYARAYNVLQGPRQPRPEPQPGSQPWNY